MTDPEWHDKPAWVVEQGVREKWDVGDWLEWEQLKTFFREREIELEHTHLGPYATGPSIPFLSTIYADVEKPLLPALRELVTKIRERHEAHPPKETP